MEGETEILFLFPIFLLSALLHGTDRRTKMGRNISISDSGVSARASDLEVTFRTAPLLLEAPPYASPARFILRNSSQ